MKITPSGLYRFRIEDVKIEAKNALTLEGLRRLARANPGPTFQAPPEEHALIGREFAIQSALGQPLTDGYLPVVSEYRPAPPDLAIDGCEGYEYGIAAAIIVNEETTDLVIESIGLLHSWATEMGTVRELVSHSELSELIVLRPGQVLYVDYVMILPVSWCDRTVVLSTPSEGGGTLPRVELATTALAPTDSTDPMYQWYSMIRARVPLGYIEGPELNWTSTPMISDNPIYIGNAIGPDVAVSDYSVHIEHLNCQTDIANGVRVSHSLRFWNWPATEDDNFYKVPLVTGFGVFAIFITVPSGMAPGTVTIHFDLTLGA